MRDHHIESIEKYAGDGSLYMTEHFAWAKQEPLNGNLIGRGISRGKDQFIHYIQVNYDSRHNVSKETLFGNLTGNASETFSLNNGQPQETEHYAIAYEYTTDGFNLPVREIQDDGTEIIQTYLPQTNLLTNKLTKKGKILQREFHDYIDGLLVGTIEDDGSAEAEEDLTDVTTRLGKRIIRRQSAPAVGFPDQVIESYIDLATGLEHQLKRTQYHYDHAENTICEEIFDSHNTLSHRLQYDYDAKGNLISQIDAIGRCFKYAYDANRNKVYEELIGSNVSTNYTYDLSNRLIREEQVHPHALLVTQHSYDYLGNRISTIDHRGHQTRYTYDDFNRQIAITYPDNATIKKSYNILGHCTAEIDAHGHATTIHYNIRGAPIAKQYPNGSQERWEYYLNGNLAKKWERNGLCQHYHYDGLNRLTQVESYDVEGHLLARTEDIYKGHQLHHRIDANGYVTEFAYDQAGRKIAEIKQDANGWSTTSFEYDALGRQCATMQWISESTAIKEIHTYDPLDRLVETRQEDLDGHIFRRKRITYTLMGDEAQQHVDHSQERTSTSETQYDTQRRPIALIDALGHTTTFHYEEQAGPSRSLRITRTDPLGHQTILQHDALERVISKEQRNPVGQRSAYEEYTYDLKGQKIEDRRWINTGGIYQVTWQYDPMGQVTQSQETGSDSSTKVTRFNYTSSGELASTHKPDGIILYQSYDLLGRLTLQTASDKSIAYSYTYDNNHNLLCSTDQLSGKQTILKYDAWNRPIDEQQANGLTLSYIYDSLGRLTRLTIPDATHVNYSYQGPHLRQVARHQFTHQYEQYDMIGNPQHMTLIGNAGNIEQQWDKLGRPILYRTPYGSETVPPNGYDAAGNLKTFHVETLQEQTTNSYNYDDLYQLTEEEGCITHHYAYDSLHNRLQKDAQTYQLDGLNQIKSDSLSHYTYDANGNLTAITGPEAQCYTYDALNRLIHAQSPSWKVTYTYDSQGRRLSKHLSHWNGEQWNDEPEELFVYQGHCEIGTMQNGRLRELRVLGLGKDGTTGAAVAIEKEGNTYVPLHDYRGNVAAIAIPSGELIETYRYSAFGEEILENTSPISPWRFASKRKDEQTKTLHFRCRDYHPGLGRWLTPDPLGFADGPNLYAYVQNNPLIFFDPWGLTKKAHQMEEGNNDNHLSIMETVTTLVNDLLENPRTHGALQVVSANFEMQAGVLLTTATGGWAAPIGACVIAHGLDQFVSGMRTVMTGEHYDSASLQLMQNAGMSAEMANMTDGTFSMVATLGGAAVVKNAVPKVAKVLGASETAIATEVQAEKALRFKPFNKDYYRHNLKVLTGENPPPSIHAHHVFTQKRRDEFLRYGINVDDPRYLTWWEGSSHVRARQTYENEWKRFFMKNNNPTSDQILEHGKLLMQEYGIKVNY